MMTFEMSLAYTLIAVCLGGIIGWFCRSLVKEEE